MDLVGNWTGLAYGTNTGNIFLNIEAQAKDSFNGCLRFNDDKLGISVYRVTGTIKDVIEVILIPIHADENVEVGTVQATLKLQVDGTLSGEWLANIGTGGTLILFPDSLKGSKQRVDSESPIPIQVASRSESIGSIVLMKEDLPSLLTIVKKDFLTAKAIFSFQKNGINLSKFEEDFFHESDQLNNLNELQIMIQEQEVLGINKIVTLLFAKFGPSEIRASGTDETWVHGKVGILKNFLKPYENQFYTFLRNHGLNINGIFFLALLIMVPEVHGWLFRTLLVVFTVLLMVAIYHLHKTFVPNTLIVMSTAKYTFFRKVWNQAYPWLFTILTAVIASTIFELIKEKSRLH